MDAREYVPLAVHVQFNYVYNFCCSNKMNK